MYSTCIFCNSSLGSNEVIEAFPVGRRLAFDPARGRLWVVCRKCERWNLTPLEERWEAFEECERRYRATRARVSTDQIGIARLSEGLELVRIGEPLRPEFAAWRYGDQFGRRRKKVMIYGGIIAGAAALAGIGLWAAGAGLSAGISAMQLWPYSTLVPVRVRLRTTEGKVLRLRANHVHAAALVRDPSDNSWLLSVRRNRRDHVFRGDEAARAAAILLPVINRMSGTRAEVRDAVRAIEEAGSPDAFIGEISRKLITKPYYDSARIGARSVAHSLALEMALHEERERRALENELHLLEEAWRDAEEIAAIADSMFVSEEHEEFIERNRAVDGFENQPGDVARKAATGRGDLS